jgi:hypothetical protein
MKKEIEKLKRQIVRQEAVIEAILRKLNVEATVEEELDDEEWARAVLTKRRKYPWN